MDILVALGKCLVFYVVIVISYRIMGKREVGQLGIIDLIVSILIDPVFDWCITDRGFSYKFSSFS